MAVGVRKLEAASSRARKAPSSRRAYLLLLIPLLLLSVLVLSSQPERASGAGPWETTASYPVSVDDESCAAANDTFVYCVGGFVGDTYTTNGSQSTAEVYYASPSPSNGSIGSWTNTTSYPEAVNTESCVVSLSSIYCVGGFTASGVSNEVYVGDLSPSGGVLAWNATNSYPLHVFSESCSAWDGYAYCVGGYTSGGLPTDAVYYAKLSSSGVGEWMETTPYPTNVTSESCLASSTGIVYCVGGITDDSPPVTDQVYYARMSPSGIASWTRSTDYPTPVDIQSCIASSDGLYCIGGGPDFAATDAVYHAGYSSGSPTDGLGSWQEAWSYPTIIGEESCVPVGQYVYCIGGSSDASDHTGAVYFVQTAELGPATTTSTVTVTKTVATPTTETVTVTARSSSLALQPGVVLPVMIIAVGFGLTVLLSSRIVKHGHHRTRPR